MNKPEEEHETERHFKALVDEIYRLKKVNYKYLELLNLIMDEDQDNMIF
ncbi:MULTISPECIES: hypothetical protein [unclassified Shewanella]